MKVLTELVNGDGQRYFVELQGSNPGRFLRMLWESCFDSPRPQSDEDACGEWTHRGQCVRTSTSGDHAYVRTHAWHPRSDTNSLPENVLKFIDNNKEEQA